MNGREYMNGVKTPILKRKFTDVFVLDHRMPWYRRIYGYVTNVYYSFYRGSAFIFKGEDVYKVNRIKAEKTYKVVYNGPWHSAWHEICET